MTIYLIGSLRNPEVPKVAAALRAVGHDVFDDWHAAGPTADDEWKRYEQERGHSYPEALDGYTAEHTYSYDKYHLNRCDAGVLVLPAGRSGHLELGYLVGQEKKTYVLLDGQDCRWDIMYRFTNGVFETLDDLCRFLEEVPF